MDTNQTHADTGQDNQTGQSAWTRLFARLSRGGAGLSVGVPVIVIIGVGFRSSWGALRDAALAAHMDKGGADLYPVAVDGLIAVAIVALLLLRDHAGPRAYCLTIITTFTGASLLLNFLHGLGKFSPDAFGARPEPEWWVTAVIAGLVIGSIGLGSHLLVLVLRHSAKPEKAPNSRKPAARKAPKAPRVRSIPAPGNSPNSLDTAMENAVQECLEALKAKRKMPTCRDLARRHQLGNKTKGNKAQKEAERRFATMNGRALGVVG